MPRDASAIFQAQAGTYDELERLSALETLKGLRSPEAVTLGDLVGYLDSRGLWAQFAKITLGDLRYDSHALDLSVTLTVLPGVNSVHVDLPSTTTVSCAPGDSAKVELDGGDGRTTVLTGTVRSIDRGLMRVRVTVADAGADLDAYA